jgi:alpha/beta superfamily hydrolase
MIGAATPRALYFGSAEEPLFGWLHAPPGDGVSDLGLVICNPFGFEEICAHRSLKSLAGAAATAGVTTLRFDYAGCGNSNGDEFEPQRFEAWVSSVHGAIEFLKQVAGVERVCLLGLRLGAMIASLAAVERDDVHGLIAIAPVVRGRAYLRELKALDAVKRQARVYGDSAGGFLESAGFLMTQETGESISRVNLLALPKAPACRVLIIERDDLPGSDNWASELERLGAASAVVHWAGYVGMMDDPRRARVPEAIVAGVVDQLVKWTVKRSGRAIDLNVVGTRTALFRASSNPSYPMVRETIVEIDTGTSILFGIATGEFETRDAVDRSARAGALMLNAGSVHHIGPDRMWVQLARAWAARGFMVLRMDISGIGDSPPRRGHADNEVYSSQAVNDVALALEYLRNRMSIEQCHLLGLCSGAYHAFKVAAAGHALASAVMINPLTFHWREGAVMDKELMEDDVLEVASKYRRMLFTREPWLKLVRGQIDLQVVILVVVRRIADVLRDRLRELARLLGVPLKVDLARELTAAAGLGTSLRFIFAARSPGYDLLYRQGGHVVRRLLQLGGLSIDLIPEADHTFTQFATRERLFCTLERLMFPNSKPPA